MSTCRKLVLVSFMIQVSFFTLTCLCLKSSLEADFFRMDSFSSRRARQLFINAVRQLGSSIGLTTSAKAIRSSLGDVRTLFQENVDRLVGNNSNQTTQERKASIPLSGGPRRAPRRRRTSHTRYPSNVIMDVDQIPGKLYQLANELEKFGRVRFLRQCVQSFPHAS